MSEAERFIKIFMRVKQFLALPSRQVVDCMLNYIGANKKLIEKYLIIGNWIDWKFIGWAIWPWILHTSKKDKKAVRWSWFANSNGAKILRTMKLFVCAVVDIGVFQFSQ